MAQIGEIRDNLGGGGKVRWNGTSWDAVSAPKAPTVNRPASTGGYSGPMPDGSNLDDHMKRTQQGIYNPSRPKASTGGYAGPMPDGSNLDDHMRNTQQGIYRPGYTPSKAAVAAGAAGFDAAKFANRPQGVGAYKVSQASPVSMARPGFNPMGGATIAQSAVARPGFGKPVVYDTDAAAGIVRDEWGNVIEAGGRRIVPAGQANVQQAAPTIAIGDLASGMYADFGNHRSLPQMAQQAAPGSIPTRQAQAPGGIYSGANAVLPGLVGNVQGQNHLGGGVIRPGQTYGGPLSNKVISEGGANMSSGAQIPAAQDDGSYYSQGSAPRGNSTPFNPNTGVRSAAQGAPGGIGQPGGGQAGTPIYLGTDATGRAPGSTPAVGAPGELTVYGGASFDPVPRVQRPQVQAPPRPEPRRELLDVPKVRDPYADIPAFDQKKYAETYIADQVGEVERSYADEVRRVREEMAARGFSQQGMSGLEADAVIRTNIARQEALGKVRNQAQREAQAFAREDAFKRAAGLQQSDRDALVRYETLAKLPAQLTAADLANESTNLAVAQVRDAYPAIVAKINAGAALAEEEVAMLRWTREHAGTLAAAGFFANIAPAVIRGGAAALGGVLGGPAGAAAGAAITGGIG